MSASAAPAADAHALGRTRLTKVRTMGRYMQNADAPRGRASGRAGAILLACAALALAPAAAQAQSPPADTTAPQAATGELAAFARALRSEARGDFASFYAQRGYWPLWIEDGEISPAADRLIEYLDSARLDDLSPRDYSPVGLEDMLARARRTGSAQDLARAELRLSRAFAGYAADLAQESGEVLYFDDAVRPDAAGAGEILARAAASGDFQDYIARMGWMHPYYASLREALASSTGRGFNQVVVLNGPTLRRGDEALRVRILRRRLGLSPSDLFDDELHEALSAFQRSRGLGADGVLGPQTVAALNSTARRQNPAALRRNLRRARELPSAHQRHILVNAASQTLTYYGDGEEQGSMRVVVGTAETPTPMMAGMLHYATLNPYWNVPVSLVKKTIAPAVLRGISLDDMGYEVLSDWTPDARVLDWRDADWRGAANGSTELRVRELPGGGNAMGSVKYQFTNDLGIYLHDTDNRSLFGKQDRFFSNGCVRLQDANELGRWLFGTMPQAEGNAPEQHTRLPEPVPVFITYMTTAPDGDGSIAYYDDTYGRDRADLRMAANSAR